MEKDVRKTDERDEGGERERERKRNHRRYLIEGKKAVFKRSD